MNRLLRMLSRKKLMKFSGLVCLIGLFSSSLIHASSNYPPHAYIQPYLENSKHAVLLFLDIDHSADMLERAYTSLSFDPDTEDGIIGYFNPQRQYRYLSSAGYFVEDAKLEQGDQDAWDGQFLNWLVLRQLDMAQWLLLGFQPDVDPQIKRFTDMGKPISLQISNSRTFSPIPNRSQITLDRGRLQFAHTQIGLALNMTVSEPGLMARLSKFPLAIWLHQPGNAAAKWISASRSVLTRQFNHWQPSLGSGNAFPVTSQDVQRLSINHAAGKQTVSTVQSECERYRYLKIASLENLSTLIQQQAAVQKDCRSDVAGDQALKFLLLSTIFSSAKTGNFTAAAGSFKINQQSELMAAVLQDDDEQHAQTFKLTGTALDYQPDGSAILYQAIYYPQRSSGDLRALLVDEHGRLRSDNGDQRLGTLKQDPVIESCVDAGGSKRIRFIDDLSNLGQTGLRCSALHYPYLDEDIGFLWRASDVLAKISDTQIPTQRSAYGRAADRRYIQTHIGQQSYAFVGSGDYPLDPAWFNVPTKKEAYALINYLRGEENPVWRNRSKGQHVLRLGDSLFSRPVVVSRPQSNFHLLYEDQDYQRFVTQYRDRRTRIFLVTQDGMVHAFNAGQFDTKTRSFVRGQGSLGDELWAFVPYGLLPFMAERARHQGLSSVEYLPLMTQSPYIFDAKVFDHQSAMKRQKDRIFTDNNGSVLSRTTHPGGWGTLMLVGFGQAGGDAGGDFKPGYLLFDITDAEQAPVFLAHIQPQGLGSSLSLASAFTLKSPQSGKDWYLALGSGTDLDPESMAQGKTQNNARIFIINLPDLLKGSGSSALRQINLPVQASYVQGISSVDWNADGVSDALYITTNATALSTINNSTTNNLTTNNSTNGTTHQFGRTVGGRLFRLSLADSTGLPLSKHQLASALKPVKLLELDQPLLDRPQLSLDQQHNRWIYLATGQPDFLLDAASQAASLSASHKLIGIKEPRDITGQFKMDHVPHQSSEINLSDLVDVTRVGVNLQTGGLSGALSLSPALQDAHVAQLESRLVDYRDPLLYRPGWLKKLEHGETATGQASVFGGFLTQATYKVTDVACELNGQAFVHQLRYTTGTAWYDESAVLLASRPANQSLNTRSAILANEPVDVQLLPMSAVSADGSTRLWTFDKDGQVTEQDQPLIKRLKSGEVSWRAL